MVTADAGLESHGGASHHNWSPVVHAGVRSRPVSQDRAHGCGLKWDLIKCGKVYSRCFAVTGLSTRRLRRESEYWGLGRVVDSFKGRGEM